MNKKSTLLIILVLFYCLGKAQTIEPFKVLFQRMTDNTFSISDEKRAVPTTSTNVSTLVASLNLFNADGSYTGELPLISEAEKDNASSKWDKHRTYLNAVKQIAVLYGYNNYYPGQIPAEHDGKAEYKALIYKTLQWYFANKKPPTSVYHETFNYQPYSGTIQGIMEYIGMLLYTDFHTDKTSDTAVQTLLDNIVNYCHHVITDNPQTRGPNWSFRYGNCMRHVLFSNSIEEMNTFMTVYNASLDFDVWAVNGTDGIWPDWSLTHHGDENYWGMYGVSWLQNTLELGAVIKDTQWEYSTEKVQFIENSITEGLQWILYKGNTEITTAPKRLTYYLERTDYIAGNVIENLHTLVNLYGDKLADKSKMEYLINNIDPSWQTSSNTYDEVTGHKYFWNTEYQVHRRSNYSIAVRRTSQRVRGPEDSSNSDIKCHLNFGNGYTSILRQGDEYRLSRLGLDYQTVAGTTTELNGVVDAGKSASTKRGGSLFSGGVQEGMFGVGAFEMKICQYNTSTNSWDIINGANALKGNFFFDKEMVCLGQNINRIKTGTAEIWTTLNQLQRSDNIVYSIDDANETTVGLAETVNQQLPVNNSAWFWHDKVGYIIKASAPANIKLLAERRTLNPILMLDSYYKNALTSEDRSLGTINMFQLVINHGTNPQNDSYNYSVVPDVTLAEFKQYMSNRKTHVIKNDANIQAVHNADDNTIEAVFYEPGSLIYNGKLISVDKKAIVMLREEDGKLFVSASNPVHRGLTPSFVESTSKTIGELYDTPLNITLKYFGLAGEVDDEITVSIQLPTDRGYEGKTVTEELIFNEGQGINTLIDSSIKENITKATVTPNPFSNQISVFSNNVFSQAQLFNIVGDIIVEKDLTQGNTLSVGSEYKNGIYILKLSGKNNSETHKLLKL